MRINNEIKKVKKLLRNGFIPVTAGENLMYVYNTETGKSYTPKVNLIMI